jgi:hypothetical protein
MCKVLHRILQMVQREGVKETALMKRAVNLQSNHSFASNVTHEVRDRNNVSERQRTFSSSLYLPPFYNRQISYAYYVSLWP